MLKVHVLRGLNVTFAIALRFTTTFLNMLVGKLRMRREEQDSFLLANFRHSRVLNVDAVVTGRSIHLLLDLL